jgi:predicted secreted protein
MCSVKFFGYLIYKGKPDAVLKLRPILILFIILALTPALLPAQDDRPKPKPKLLDGELIEEGQPPPAPAPAQPAPENNTSQTVTLRKEFSVTLPSNPSTGYGWKVAAYDREFLQLLRNRYQKPDQPRPGAGGQELFDFLPLKSGTTSIVFHYQRPFGKQAVRELRHTVIIK